MKKLLKPLVLWYMRKYFLCKNCGDTECSTCRAKVVYDDLKEL